MSKVEDILLRSGGRYAALRRQAFAAGASETGNLFETTARSLSELEIQSRWFAGDFGRTFRSTCGQDVEIVQFGFWNHAAGPDFTDAVVRIDGADDKGAIELDSQVRDWEHHGHAENPAYNRVVLHVFMEPLGERRFFTRTADHRNVVQVKVDLEALDEATSAGSAMAEARTGRCSAPFRDMRAERIDDLLHAAAQYRLERKARRMRRLRDAHGREEALYQGVADALGYRRNSFPMRVLSQRLPLRTLRQRQGPEERDALLFGVSGFLEGGSHVEPSDSDTRNYQRDLWSIWWKERESFAAAARVKLPWQSVGVRPSNHPQRRVAALAALIGAWRQFSESACADPFDEKALRAVCLGLKHPFWSRHYTLRAAPSPKPLALIGKARVLDIVANQIYPLRLLDAPEPVWDSYAGLPASQDNEKVRRAILRLFGALEGGEAFARKLYQQQALLQIYDDYCLADASDCAQCPFPEQILRW